MILLHNNPAPGGPGTPPRWTRGAKDAVGTAYSTSSHVWFTFSDGCVNEVYYPTIDSPQIRDLQLLFTDGKTFFHDERRHFTPVVECISAAALGVRAINRNAELGYEVEKEIIGDPHQNCVLMHCKISGDPGLLANLQIYALCAPHLEIGGWHNDGQVMLSHERTLLVAHKGGVWMVMGAMPAFAQGACGYVGVNDGWTDLAQNFRLDFDFDCAFDGNIALTGQIAPQAREFTIGLALGTTLHDATTTFVQSTSVPFAIIRENFIHQWDRTSKRFHLTEKLAARESKLFSRSVNLLLAHEDKTYPGAMIAGMSIPWGSTRGDEELGGYHLVWTRDLVQCAGALLSVGDNTTPFRALLYLSVAQRDDGGFYQNFWIDGEPYWRGTQLDEVSFPVILAWRLWQADALMDFDPLSMICRAMAYLVREGPKSPQDRWEEPCGYSPNTLGINIVALLCAAEFIEGHDRVTAEFLRAYADFLECHLEPWTVTNKGTLLAGVSRHYVRANPANDPAEDPDANLLTLANQPPGAQYRYPANQIVDAGFLDLVRYGIRRADDPVIVDSLRVVDALLKVDLPAGPCWKRYNHDGYGQRADGSAYAYWGAGHAWPLLTGERGHYELAAGRDPRPCIDAMENFAVGMGLIPEQVWDAPDIPDNFLHFGGPTGAAIPLMWAHAEYVKLLRSYVDGKVFECVEPVAQRYARRPPAIAGSRWNEVWKPERQVPQIGAGTPLRIIRTGRGPFRLHWSTDGWRTIQDTDSTATLVEAHFVDVETRDSGGPVLFTFFWPNENRWEGIDYKVEVEGK